MDHPELTPRQLREVQTSLRHMGRAMRALNRAALPYPVQGQGWLFALHGAERRVGQASDQMIDGLETLAQWGSAPLSPNHTTGVQMPEHEPRARYCILIVGIPVSELRDDLTCPACDDDIRLMMLDPDVEVLAPPAHLSTEQEQGE